MLKEKKKEITLKSQNLWEYLYLAQEKAQEAGKQYQDIFATMHRTNSFLLFIVLCIRPT